MKLSTSSGLAVADYFEMDNQASENGSDTDLGSGGEMLLPDLSDGSGHTMHLAVGAGKDSNLYVVNRDNMGKFSTNNTAIYQELAGELPGGVWAMPAYFNNTVYYGSVGSPIQAFTIANAKLSTSATAQTPNSFGYPGATPSISANGASNGIVWAVENSGTAVLHAYNATNLNELYNSNQASGGRDNFGAGNKFITPMIVNGKVFVGTPNGVGRIRAAAVRLLVEAGKVYVGTAALGCPRSEAPQLSRAITTVTREQRDLQTASSTTTDNPPTSQPTQPAPDSPASTQSSHPAFPTSAAHDQTIPAARRGPCGREFC